MRSPEQKGYVTARWLAPIRLVAAMLIVVGLAVSVPPSFGHADSDHFGLLLHPLFPHAHGSAGSLYTPDGTDAAHGDSTSVTSDTGSTLFDQTPGIRTRAADEVFRSVISGIVLPTILAGALLQLRQLKRSELRLAQQAWRGPPTPPPRILPLSS